jgi:hypothetical protein
MQQLKKQELNKRRLMLLLKQQPHNKPKQMPRLRRQRKNKLNRRQLKQN